MNTMEAAHWRSYRRHMIIAGKSFLGRRRYEVWKRGQLMGSFRNVVEAELHVDALIAGDSEFQDQADPTARELLATLTADERSVLESLVQGHSLRASADRLGLSTKEAQAIRKDLFAKIGAESESEALRIGRYGGLADQRPETGDGPVPSGQPPAVPSGGER